MSATLTRCLLCEGALDGSLEHVFPRALGGTKVSRALYCGMCNIRLGREIDAGFADDYKFVTTLLNIRRDGNPPPSIKVLAEDGSTIWLGPGGVPEKRGPWPTKVEAEGGNSRTVTITVPFNQLDLHDHMIKKAARELGCTPDAFNASSSLSMRTVPVPPVMASIGFGGPAQCRAACKIALGFLALQIGDEVFSQRYLGLRNALVVKDPTPAWLRRPLDPMFAPIHPRTDTVRHCVVIYSTETETWAHVEVYGTCGFAVLLAEAADVRFKIPYFWTQSPVTGEFAEGWTPWVAISLQTRTHQDLAFEDHVRLRRAMSKISREVAIRRAVDEEFAFAFASSEFEMAIDEKQLDVVMARIYARVVAVYCPGTPVVLDRPIASREELARIRKDFEELRRGRNKGLYEP